MVTKKITQTISSLSISWDSQNEENKKCDWLRIFFPHHQTLTGTSDEEAHKGSIVDYQRNERNPPGARIVYDPFGKRFKLDVTSWACHLTLLLVPEMLMVLELWIVRGSPRCEVPTRPHTVCCRSPIRYDGPISIILNIFLISCLSAHDSGLICLRIVRFVCLLSA